MPGVTINIHRDPVAPRAPAVRPTVDPFEPAPPTDMEPRIVPVSYPKSDSGQDEAKPSTRVKGGK